VFSLRGLGSVRCWRFGLAFCDAGDEDGGYMVLYGFMVGLAVTRSHYHYHYITLFIYPSIHPPINPSLPPSLHYPSLHPSPPNVQSLILPATHTHTLTHSHTYYTPRLASPSSQTVPFAHIHSTHSLHTLPPTLPPFLCSYHLYVSHPIPSQTKPDLTHPPPAARN
jgi:hypothetical protein